MGGVGDLTRSVADGIAGLVGGAVDAIGQQVLPGPWFFVAIGGLVVLLLLWVLRH